jgi:thymidine phosphorylase
MSADTTEASPTGAAPHHHPANSVRVRRLGLDTQYEAIVFMHKECHVCRSEGFIAHTRVLLCNGARQVIATLYHATGALIAHDEAALSESAWTRLGLRDGDRIVVTHPPPLDSLSHVRSRIYGHELGEASFHAIIADIVEGKYSGIHLASFLTACAARALDHKEILALTQAMVEAGDRLKWPAGVVVDKHCVGGLPGNRTTPIIVAIAAALGLVMPKTSSRAITSPAGTADTMETMAPVELDTTAIRRVVEQEGGCVVWGGAVNLSPADDILIRVERALDLDTEGQLIASVLSKKLAAGSTHLVIDLPVGPTAKVRTAESAQALSRALTSIAETFGLMTRVVATDGSQPVGRGIGPALEARDVLAVLQCAPDAPRDLRQRALVLTSALLELAGKAAQGQGEAMAAQVLDSGRAWTKFQRICQAQGGMRVPPGSRQTRPLLAERTGKVDAIDNRKTARLAKLAGAPDDKAAGVDLHVSVGERVSRGQPLCTVHADAPGVLAYAFEYAEAFRDIFVIREP